MLEEYDGDVKVEALLGVQSNFYGNNYHRGLVGSSMDAPLELQ